MKVALKKLGAALLLPIYIVLGVFFEHRYSGWPDENDPGQFVLEWFGFIFRVLIWPVGLAFDHPQVTITL